MRLIHLYFTMVAAAVWFGCESEPAPATATLNYQILFKQGDVAEELTGSCATLVLGHGSPTPGSGPGASRAPDLIIAETFDGYRLSVAARTTGTSETRKMSFDFNLLKSGTQDSFTLASALGGMYEVRYWTDPTGSCQYEPGAPSPPF